MTTPSPAEIVKGLTKFERHALLRAWPLSGPSGDYIALGMDRDILLYHDDGYDLVHPDSGRLLPLGLAVRALLDPKA